MGDEQLTYLVGDLLEVLLCGKLMLRLLLLLLLTSNQHRGWALLNWGEPGVGECRVLRQIHWKKTEIKIESKCAMLGFGALIWKYHVVAWLCWSDKWTQVGGFFTCIGHALYARLLVKERRQVSLSTPGVIFFSAGKTVQCRRYKTGKYLLNCRKQAFQECLAIYCNSKLMSSLQLKYPTVEIGTYFHFYYIFFVQPSTLESHW